jgi:hypothetical protein
MHTYTSVRWRHTAEETAPSETPGIRLRRRVFNAEVRGGRRGGRRGLVDRAALAESGLLLL